jgi:hypothetical protein
VVATHRVSYHLDVDLSPGRVAVACRHFGTWLNSGSLALVDQAWHVGWLGVVTLIIV